MLDLAAVLPGSELSRRGGHCRATGVAEQGRRRDTATTARLNWAVAEEAKGALSTESSPTQDSRSENRCHDSTTAAPVRHMSGSPGRAPLLLEGQSKGRSSAGPELASQLLGVVIERGDVVLPHQREESRQGDLCQLGSLSVSQAARADFFEKPEETHLLSDLARLPRPVLESLIRKIHTHGFAPSPQSCSWTKVYPGLPVPSPDTCPPAHRTPVNRTPGRTPVRDRKLL